MDLTFLDTVVEAQLKNLGNEGLAKVQDGLAKAAAAEPDAWKKNVYALVAGAVATYGPEGVNKALGAAHDLLLGKADTDLSWADLGVASDLLAAMENKETDQATASHAFLVQVGGVVEQLAKAAIASLV